MFLLYYISLYTNENILLLYIPMLNDYLFTEFNMYLKLPATVALLLVLLLFELADLFLGGIPLLYGEHVRARKQSNFKSCRDVLG